MTDHDPAPPTQGGTEPRHEYVPGEPLTPEDNRAKVPKPTPDPSEPGSEQEAMEAWCRDRRYTPNRFTTELWEAAVAHAESSSHPSQEAQ